jgi:long-chain acyl-CoA synthetase
VVPRILERLYEKMTAAADFAVGPKKWIMHQAIRSAKIEDPHQHHLFHKIYEPLVYSRMRAALGDNFKLIISGSSPLNKSIIRFLLNIGLPIYEGYGLTECSPVVSANYQEHWKMGSVGLPLAHLSVKIGKQNEVLVKGDSVFHGYHNLPEINKESFTADGYFKTGDQGLIDRDGYLFITGRIKEMLKTSTGKYVSPLPIELELSRHPLIEAALVIANNRKFASALIFLNAENARRILNLHEKDFDATIAARNSERITTAIAHHVSNINKKLSHWEKIQKWVIIPDELTIESGLLTPTLKLRRKTTENRYAAEIEALYAISSVPIPGRHNT